MSICNCIILSKDISDYRQAPENGSLTLLQLPLVVLQRIGDWVVSGNPNAFKDAISWGKVCVLTHCMSHHGQVGRIIQERQMAVFTKVSNLSRIFILSELGQMENRLNEVPFTDHERVYLEPLCSCMNFMAKDATSHADFFTKCIVWTLPELCSRAVMPFPNRAVLTEEYRSALTACLKQMLNRRSLTLENRQMAAQLSLVNTLEKNKIWIVYNDAAKRMKWVNLLTSLQEECDTDSTLLADVQLDLGPAFFDRPLPEFLFFEEVEKELFQSIYRVRQARFQEEGLKISVEAE